MAVVEHESAVAALRVFAVVVAYDPEPTALRRLLARLRPQVERVILVDNSDRPPARAAIAGAAASCGVETLVVGRNSGIAHAQNVGAARAIELGARCLLFSDDDSVPATDMVERLVVGLRRAAEPPRAGLPGSAGIGAAADAKIAAVGPRVFDVREPSAALVFRDTALGPRRARVEPGDGRPVAAAFLVASGCLIPVEAWRAIGPMREDLFIDHVDLEWGVRARAAGWSLFAIGDAALEHRLGDQVLRPWFLRGRRIHVHSPVRNYYLARNTLLLVRGGGLPAGWRFGYLVWLAKYVAFNVLFVAPRLRRLRYFGRALVDALAGRGGALPIQ